MSDLYPYSILQDKNGNAISSYNDGTYNRLCVDTRPTAGVSAQQLAWGTVPAAQTIVTPLTKSGSSALNVNGSTTPQVFTYAAGAKAISIYAVRLGFSFTTVTFNGTNFGAAGVTNGVVVSATISGTSTNVFTLKTNEDFFLANGNGILTSGGTGIMMTATIIFNQPLAVNSTDQVAVTVADNLSVANYLYGRAIAFGVRAA